MKKKKQSCARRISALLTAIMLMASGISLAPEQHIEAGTSQAAILEKYSKEKDVATQIYPGRQASDMSFLGTEYAQDSYNLTFNAKYAENPEVEYEGLRFIVASAQEVVKGRKVDIHLNIRDDNLFIWARPMDGSPETGLLYGYGLIKGKKGENNQYAIRYSHGKIWLFENEQVVLDGFDLAGNEIPGETERYCNVKPYIQLTNEECKSVWYSNLRLWGEGVTFTGGFPAMPAGNGDYGPTVGIRSVLGSSTELVNGVLKNSNVCTDLVAFKRLPFGDNDTYVSSFDMTTEEADISWKGVRPIIRSDKDFKEYYQLLFTDGAVLLNYNNSNKETSETVASSPYSRTLGKSDHIGMVVSPDSFSLWINGVMVMHNIKLEHALPANIGVKYEFAKATISNLSFYYKDSTPFIIPAGDPEIPVLTSDMYNAAQYMVVTGQNGPVSYQNYEIKRTADVDELHYEFSNIPMPKDGEYVFRASVTQHSEWTEPWRGTRLKYRTGDAGDYYLYFLKDSLYLTTVPNQDGANYPVEIEVGRTYDIAIKSNASTVTVWLDGKVVFDNVALTDNGEKTKAATGIWFELCEADVQNIQIYGKDVVFTEDTFDVRLKNDKWFNMTTVPEMPAGGTNYFQNVKFGSETNKDILPSYKDGVFSNIYSDSSAPVDFVDQEDSHNLNGLKNSDTYVWSAKVKANSFNASYKNEEGEEVKDVGIGFIVKNTTHPGGSGDNTLGLYLLKNRAELQSYSNGSMDHCYTSNEFEFNEGQEYQVDMLIGSGWMKVWLDNKLTFTAWDLPTYNVDFRLQVINSAMEVSNIKVYTVERSKADVHEVKEEVQEAKTGNTIKGMKDAVIKLAQAAWKQPVGILLILAVLIGWGAFVYLKIRNLPKQKKKKEVEVNEKTD